MSDKNLIHKKWMKRAISLALLGKGKTSPNPLVGAVILDKNRNLISEGFHHKAGTPRCFDYATTNVTLRIVTFCQFNECAAKIILHLTTDTPVRKAHHLAAL